MTVDVARPAVMPNNPALREKIEYATFLASTELLPDHFKKKPASVLWAMEYADALGLPNAAVAIASIHVIKNKPAPSAAMAAGLVRSKGHRLRVWVEPPNPEKGQRWGKAVAELRRHDDPDFTFRAEWTVEDAIKAEICKISDDGRRLLQWNSTKSKWEVGNWERYTRQMMKARALGEVCRDGATDVLMGLVYLAEEMEDVVLDRNGQAVTPADAVIPTVRAADVLVEDDARPLAEHTVDVDTSSGDPAPMRDSGPDSRLDESTPGEPDPASLLPASAEQVRLLNIRMADLGVKSRERKLKLIGLALESEPPASSGNLTSGQAEAVMDQLRNEDALTVAAWLDQPPTQG